MKPGRLILRLACLGLAAIASIVQLDQQTRLSPFYAELVPDFLSGNAARERSKLALLIGASDIALREARKQVALRPMPAESLTVLALSALQAGEAQTAQTALGAASRRGWREPFSQLASAQAALEQGQYEIASQRTVALLATGNLTEPATVLLGKLAATPEGREAFATRMASFGRWQERGLMLGARAADPENWSATILLALEKGADLPCEQITRVRRLYEKEGNVAAAQMLSSRGC